MPEHNVDIRFADLPIAHRFAAWAITRKLRFTYHEVLGALADCRAVEVCDCGGPECATITFAQPHPSHLSLPTGGTYWMTTAGLIGLASDRVYMEIEALTTDEDDTGFPHRSEIHHALREGYSPTRNLHAREARRIFREWLAGLEERELAWFGVDA